MVRYFVNNREVELNADLSFEIIRENVLVKKAGDYSLDISIDLRSKVNRDIYEQPLRIQSSFEYADRKAELWVDDVCLMSGSEAVLEISDREARVQIVCNNSEMIYKFNSKKKIRNLDLGRVETRTPSLAAAEMGKSYPEASETYPVVLKHDVGLHTLILGEVEGYNIPANEEGATTFDDKTDLMPQPFLLAIIDKVLKAIGYEVGSNEIDIDKYKHVVMIQNYNRENYAKMLPDWTVEEFLSEVEKFFNVILDFNSDTKKVNIISVRNFYKGRNHVQIGRENVIDMFSVDIQKEPESFQTSYDNVGYSLPSDNYFKAQRIDEALMEESVIKEKVWSFPNLYEGYEYDKTIYHDAEIDIQWIATKASAGMLPEKVNEFADVVKNEFVKKNELKIGPTKIANHYYFNSAGSVNKLVPVLNKNDATEEQTYEQLITEGKNEIVPERIEIAFCIDMIYNRCECVTTYWNSRQGSMMNFGTQADWVNEKTTLKLTGKDGRYRNEFKNEISLNTKTVFTIQFLNRDFLDPKMIYELGEETFYCKSLKYVIEKCKKSKIVEGEFYKAMTPEEEDEPVITTWNLFIKTAEGSTKTMSAEYGGVGYIVKCENWTELKIDTSITNVDIIAPNITNKTISGWNVTDRTGKTTLYTNTLAPSPIVAGSSLKRVRLNRLTHHDYKVQPVFI